MPRKTSPVFPLLTISFFILSWIYLQLGRTPLSYFNTKKGKIIRYKTKYNPKIGNDILILWLNDTLKPPYISYYISPNTAILNYLNKNKNPNVTIWVNSDREIKQMKSNTNKIVNYDWFVPLYLPFLVYGLFSYFYLYRLTKNTMNNVKSHKHMWEYIIGRRVLISKETNKPFKEEPPSWFGLFNLKKKKK